MFLMRIKSPEGLRFLVRSFVVEAVFVLEGFSGELKTSDFDERWFSRVAEDTGLSVEEVKGIHHPFYWMICGESDFPIGYKQPETNGDCSKIFLRKMEIDEDALYSISEKMLRRYGDYFRARLNGRELDSSKDASVPC